MSDERTDGRTCGLTHSLIEVLARDQKSYAQSDVLRKCIALIWHLRMVPALYYELHVNLSLLLDTILCNEGHIRQCLPRTVLHSNTYSIGPMISDSDCSGGGGGGGRGGGGHPGTWEWNK